MRTLPLNINVLIAGRRSGLKNLFRSLFTQIGKSVQKMVRVALVIVIGVLFLFGFYVGFTLLALKILL
jgi:type IV secretory pathway VirB2 component (pilin)